MMLPIIQITQLFGWILAQAATTPEDTITSQS